LIAQKPIKKLPLLRPSNSSIAVGIGVCVAFALLTFLFIPIAPTTDEAAVTAPVQPYTPPAPQAQVPPEATNDQLVLELFNPSELSLTHQITKASLTQQIEQAITVSFVLSKCGLISADQYRDSFRALVLYAQQSHLADDAPRAEAMVRQIAKSAGAGYSLVYSRLSCSHPQLPQLAKQLVDWQTRVMPPSP